MLSLDETYRSFFRSLVFVTPNGVICDIEGMVPRRDFRVESSLDHERVCLSTYNVDLWYQQAIYVPGYTPSHVTCKYLRLVIAVV